MLDDLRALAIFAAVGREGSFRAAATALGLSPQVVSHHISSLESRRGVALIHRSTRALRLTPDGARLLDHAARMSDAAAEGLDELSASQEEPAGALSVALSTLFRHSPYLDWIAAFGTKYERIDISLSFSEARRDLIRDGFDVAIRIGGVDPANLRMRKLTEIPRTLVAAPDVAARHPRPETPADLEAWNWVGLATANPKRVFSHPDGRRMEIEARGRMTVDNAEAMTGLAVAGFGLAPAPAHMVQDSLSTGALVEVLPDWRMAPLNVYALTPMNAPRRSLGALFVNHLAAQARTRSLAGS